MTACAGCGTPLVSAPAPPGSLAPVWAHATAPADGHAPAVPPVTVTYSSDRGWWHADCPEVPGFPVVGMRSRDEVKSVAWVLLGRISPTRPVIEREESREITEN